MVEQEGEHTTKEICDELRSIIERLNSQLSTLIRHTPSCERCGQAAPTDVITSIAGLNRVTVCNRCSRDWDLDAKALSLATEIGALNVRTSAFVRTGIAELAESAYRQTEELRTQLRQYAVLWLTTKPGG